MGKKGKVCQGLPKSFIRIYYIVLWGRVSFFRWTIGIVHCPTKNLHKAGLPVDLFEDVPKKDMVKCIYHTVCHEKYRKEH